MNDNPLDTKSLDAGPPPSPFDALFLLSENPNPKATADSKSIAPKPVDQNRQSQTTTLDFTADPIYPTDRTPPKPESPKETPQPDTKLANEPNALKVGEPKPGDQKTDYPDNLELNTASIYESSSTSSLDSKPTTKAKPESPNECPPASDNGVVRKDSDGHVTVTHEGPGPVDNYNRTYTESGTDGCTETKVEILNPDGTNTWKYPDGKTIIVNPQTGDVNETFNSLSHVQVKQESWNQNNNDFEQGVDNDGTVTNIFGDKKNPRAEFQDPDGTKIIKYPDNSVTVEKEVNGQAAGYSLHPDKDGGYTKIGYGPGNNYHESYDPHTRVTTTTDETGTTRLLPNGTKLFLGKDGENIRYNPDGSENHYGKENFDKPAWDYKNDASVKSARQEMFAEAESNLPPEAFAAFKKDAADFEARAPKSKIPPDKVAETYENIAMLMKSKPDAKGMNDSDKALLAAALMHETAHPEDIGQGHHETCNMTVVGREALTKNPADMTAFVTNLALHGEATAPDSTKVKVDRQSLIPGVEESTYPPEPGARSIAGQLIDVGLVNYALEKRSPSESYTQEPFPKPGDSGERKLDQQGHVIDTQPAVTENEISKTSAVFCRQDFPHVIGPSTDMDSHAINVDNATELKQQLQILQDQHKMPVIVAVDALHYPIVDHNKEHKGFGGHVVTVDDYNPNDGTVQLTNQWGPEYNKRVKVDDLFNNMSGKRAAGT